MTFQNLGLNSGLEWKLVTSLMLSTSIVGAAQALLSASFGVI